MKWLILFIVGCFIAQPIRAEVWDVSRDFSAVNNAAGPWAYGSTGDRTAPITLYTDTTLVPQAYSTTQLAGWSNPSIGVTPYIAKNVSSSDWNYDGTGAGGGPAVLRPGEVLLLPRQGPDQFSIVRWTAPRAGIFRVEATFTRFENKQGYNSNYFVMRNGVDLDGGTGILTGFGGAESTATFASAELTLEEGDTLSFAVGFGTDASDQTDGTTLRAVIRAVDGFGDLIVQHQTDRRIALLAPNGAAIVSSATVQPMLPPNWRVAAAGDFNGDGRRDIVVQNSSTRAVSLLIMNGSRVQSSVPVNPTLPPNWQLKAAADFDGDGNLDLAVQNLASQQIAVLLMDGATILRSRSFSKSLATGWHIAGAADFSGDGGSDLVVQNTSTRQISILALNGFNVAGSIPLRPNLPPNWFVGAVGNFDGDSSPDLVLQNSSTQQVSVLSIVNAQIARSFSLRPAPPAGWTLVGPK